jgi:hypothetical protein
VDVAEGTVGKYENLYIMCENGKTISHAYLHSSTADLHFRAFIRF